MQIAKLELETKNLNEEDAHQRASIEAREAEMLEQEATVKKCLQDFATIKIQRDELQEQRKWVDFQSHNLNESRSPQSVIYFDLFGVIRRCICQ